VRNAIMPQTLTPRKATVTASQHFGSKVHWGQEFTCSRREDFRRVLSSLRRRTHPLPSVCGAYLKTRRQPT
jgi:hypothetical protein